MALKLQPRTQLLTIFGVHLAEQLARAIQQALNIRSAFGDSAGRRLADSLDYWGARIHHVFFAVLDRPPLIINHLAARLVQVLNPLPPTAISSALFARKAFSIRMRLVLPVRFSPPLHCTPFEPRRHDPRSQGDGEVRMHVLPRFQTRIFEEAARKQRRPRGTANQQNRIQITAFGPRPAALGTRYQAVDSTKGRIIASYSSRDISTSRCKGRKSRELSASSRILTLRLETQLLLGFFRRPPQPRPGRLRLRSRIRRAGVYAGNPA